MSRRNGTDGSLLPSLPWTLIALGFAVAPHVQYLPVWVTVTSVVCAALRWQIEKRRWRLPPAWVRIVLSLVCFVGVLASYESVSGVGPGSALLAVMAALKMLETKERRDQFVLLFICIFLIMSSLLREQYLWSLPYLLAGVLVTMTAWLRMSDNRPVRVSQSFATGGRLLMYAAPIALAMWIFFPRIATPFWAVPIDTSSATSGLSDRMSPGDISSLSMSDAVAFRVVFEGTVPPSRLRYWRGLVLHRFNGRTWSGREATFDRDALRSIEFSGEPISYQVTMEANRQHWVFALDMPADWSLAQTFMGSQHQLSRVQPIDQRISYRAVSHTSYQAAAELEPFARSWYTRLPQDSNPETRELAEQMRRAAPGDDAYIADVMRMFHQQEFFYTLEPPPLGSNPVDRFLFDTRRGFCEHYASAFAVMMRAVGIPSRVVLGYQGGELNPMGQYLIVRQADAHAWTEVWLPGRGWQRVDPTSAVAPERIESGISGAMFDGIGASWGLTAPSELLHQLTLTLDAMNAKWNEWVLGYGPENQGRFMQWLGMENPDWRKMMLTLLALVTIIVGIISTVLVRRYRPPSKDRATILYRRFIRKSGVERACGEPPLTFVQRLAARERNDLAQARAITDFYLQARYGPPDPQWLGKLRAAVVSYTAA